MQIIEKETDKTVYDFITDDKAMELVLDYGKTYIAREIETVESYYKNVEDVEFIATPNLTVDFYNSPIFTRLQVNKIDKDTKELIINNPFTFAVFADKKMCIRDRRGTSTTERGVYKNVKRRTRRMCYVMY